MRRLDDWTYEVFSSARTDLQATILIAFDACMCIRFERPSLTNFQMSQLISFLRYLAIGSAALDEDALDEDHEVVTAFPSGFRLCFAPNSVE